MIQKVSHEHYPKEVMGFNSNGINNSERLFNHTKPTKPTEPTTYSNVASSTACYRTQPTGSINAILR
jgi:hypothetical protein